MIDFAAIRVRHPLTGYLESLGVRLRRQGSSYIAKCPLHNERNGMSFSVSGEHWRCWGKCAASGDVIDFERLYFSLPDLLTAAHHLEGEELPSLETGKSFRDSRKLAEPAAPPPLYRFNRGDLKRIQRGSYALRKAPELIFKVLGDRPNWDLDVIRETAIDGDLGYVSILSWHDQVEPGPAVLFVYGHGIKARWKNKFVRWYCGGPFGQCWRQSLMYGGRKRVFITEGETDALSLLSDEVEDENSLIVALAGASVWPDAEPFRDKEVVIVRDPDLAGQQSANRLSELLKPVVSRLAVYTPNKESSVGNG